MVNNNKIKKIIDISENLSHWNRKMLEWVDTVGKRAEDKHKIGTEVSK